MKKFKSSTDHFTGREQEALHGIRRQLANEVQPLLVLCLGSMATTTLRRNLSTLSKRPATGFRFVCELVLVLPEGANLLKDRAALRALERRLAHHAEVTLEVLTPEALAAQLASGRNARIHVHSDAIVLYERDHTLAKVVQMAAEIASAARRNDGTQGRSSGSAVGNTASLRQDPELPYAIPVGLSAVERANPLSVVSEFYRLYDLREVREHITVWMQAAVSVPTWPVAETGLHLDFYVALCRLMECASLLQGFRPPAWVAQGLGVVGAGLPPQSFYCPRDNADAWDYFPTHLTRAELTAPGAVFQDLFSGRSLPGWLDELYRLFSYSLTDCTPALLGEDWDMAALTTRLHRLVEASHLISVWQRRAGGECPAVTTGETPVCPPTLPPAMAALPL